MLDTGFVSLHRSILKWEWYADLTTFKLFTHLLLSVNWREERLMGHSIKRCQRVCSLNTLAAETGLSEKQIRTAINHLKSTGEVASEIIRVNRSGCALYTVINFDKYQENERPTAGESAGEGQVKGRSRAGEGRIMNNTNKAIIHNNAIKVGSKGVSSELPPQPTATEKARFGNLVFLTAEQKELLDKKYGEEKTDKLISTLDQYKAETGKQYSSDYHALVSWVPHRLERLESDARSESIPFSLDDFTERPD